MNSEINSVEFEAMRIMQSHLSNEKKNYELKLKKWLESPIETKRTDALKEHDLVV